MQNCFKFLTLILAIWLLSACVSKTVTIVSEDPESLRRGQIAAFSLALTQLGVQFEQVGETIRIAIPSDKLFNPSSGNINPFYGEQVLNIIAHLMRMLETTSVRISGFTNLERSAILNNALSERQAQTVLDYFWIQGIDARVLYAVGFGSRQALSRNPQKWENRRVEIYFKYFPLGLGR